MVEDKKVTTSFRLLGIEFSGPTWMALVFILFCLIVLYFFAPAFNKQSILNIQEKKVETAPAINNKKQFSTKEINNEKWQDKPL